MAAEQILIDANEAKKRLRAVHDWFCGYPGTEQDKLARSVAKMCIKELEKVKPADAVEVVYCKDCARCKKGYCTIRKDSWGATLRVGQHDYCSDGERRTDNG